MSKPQTSIDSYLETIDSGEDLTLRKVVALVLRQTPMTRWELANEALPEKSENALGARIPELKRRGLITAIDTKENPSGREAQVYTTTEEGDQWLAGEIPEPDPLPSLQEVMREVAQTAENYVQDTATEADLQAAVGRWQGVRRCYEHD